MTETKLVTRHLIEAEKGNDRARLVSYHCTLEGDCPLLAAGQCIHVQWLATCVYGKAHTQHSQTKRAKSYRGFVVDAREAMKDQSQVKAAEDRIAYIGEYVYLPYAHMSHDDGKHFTPFLSHSHIFSSGSPFMPKESFTSEMVVKLFNFKPRAMMGGIIRPYTEVSLPKFLLDLSEYDPGLYAAAVALEPGIADVVAKVSPNQFTAFELGGYIGHVQIDGQTYFRYSKGNVKADIELLSGFPTDGTVTVQFKPRPDTVCTVLDRKDAIKLLKMVTR